MTTQENLSTKYQLFLQSADLVDYGQGKYVFQSKEETYQFIEFSYVSGDFKISESLFEVTEELKDKVYDAFYKSDLFPSEANDLDYEVHGIFSKNY